MLPFQDAKMDTLLSRKIHHGPPYKIPKIWLGVFSSESIGSTIPYGIYLMLKPLQNSLSRAPCKTY
jgi:hypothetical protein